MKTDEGRQADKQQINKFGQQIARNTDRKQK